jgi:hypothetical protein
MRLPRKRKNGFTAYCGWSAKKVTKSRIDCCIWDISVFICVQVNWIRTAYPISSSEKVYALRTQFRFRRMSPPRGDNVFHIHYFVFLSKDRLIVVCMKTERPSASSQKRCFPPKSLPHTPTECVCFFFQLVSRPVTISVTACSADEHTLKVKYLHSAAWYFTITCWLITACRMLL